MNQNNTNENKNKNVGTVDKIINLYSNNSQIIGVVILTLISYSIITGRIPFELDVNPTYVAIGQYVLFGVIFVAVFGGDLLEKFISKEVREIIVLNMDSSDPPERYELGEEAWMNMTVEKRLYGPPKMKFALDYDMEENHATGVWIEELSDKELMKYRSKLQEAIHILQEEMVEGIAKESTAKTAVMRSQKSIIEAFSNNLMKHTSISGAELKEVFDETMESSKLGAEIEDMEDIMSDTVEDLEEETVKQSEMAEKSTE